MNVSKVLFVLAMLVGSVVSAEEYAVIVNPGNAAMLSKDLVSSYYMGDIKAWTGGLPVRLLDLPLDSAVRVAFDKNVLGKSTQQMKDLWMKNAMSGKADPPKEMSSDADVKSAVASSRYAMGYIKAANVDDTVKVILKF